MKFASRTGWHHEHNVLTRAVETRRRSGLPIIDVTLTNPTECGFDYPIQDIQQALAGSQSLHYQPDPRGLLSAREAVAGYYRERKIQIDPSSIFLTSGTSEAYSVLLKLLCNVGDEILVPAPSYPLFEYLAQLHDVKLCHYNLFYDHGWHLDISSMTNAISASTKALVLLHPHNPTGMFLKSDSHHQIMKIAKDHKLAVIIDEVFVDYGFEEDGGRVSSMNSSPPALTFTLNGISKMVGLPQMKLGWILVNGVQSEILEASERLETILDTYLSVNTPVQVALPELLRSGKKVQSQILNRVRSNFEYLRRELGNGAGCSLLESEGGWYGIIRLPRTRSEEEWCLWLLESAGLALYPGYYFDFAEDGFLVISLLVEPIVLEPAVRKITDLVRESLTL